MFSISLFQVDGWLSRENDAETFSSLLHSDDGSFEGQGLDFPDSHRTRSTIEHLIMKISRTKDLIHQEQIQKEGWYCWRDWLWVWSVVCSSYYGFRLFICSPLFPLFLTHFSDTLFVLSLVSWRGRDIAVVPGDKFCACHPAPHGSS